MGLGSLLAFPGLDSEAGQTSGQPQGRPPRNRPGSSGQVSRGAAASLCPGRGVPGAESYAVPAVCCFVGCRPSVGSVGGQRSPRGRVGKAHGRCPSSATLTS